MFHFSKKLKELELFFNYFLRFSITWRAREASFDPFCSIWNHIHICSSYCYKLTHDFCHTPLLYWHQLVCIRILIVRNNSSNVFPIRRLVDNVPVFPLYMHIKATMIAKLFFSLCIIV